MNLFITFATTISVVFLLLYFVILAIAFNDYYKIFKDVLLHNPDRVEYAKQIANEETRYPTAWATGMAIVSLCWLICFFISK